ncbi:MAG: 4-hydroxythreonine-4-phosphate dehydrogenase [Candidatus Azotimanducaceae bacterium]|jgi:4-hydroxythreonine-4-phosphate dehydrogenase
MHNITLAVTPGEPAGIGPDLVLLHQKAKGESSHPIQLIIADPELLALRKQELGLASLNIHEMSHEADIKLNEVNVWPIKLGSPVKTGKLDPSNAHYVIACLEQAVKFCEQGICQGIVTGPIQKSIINEAGIPFSGHTEWLADRTKTPFVVMMLESSKLRVALATTHLPLRDVADAIKAEPLLLTLEIIHQSLKQYIARPNPRILVCGLNPHAGENGHLGMEEIEIIIPTIKKAQEKGINAIGPLPADTAFTPASLKGADIVLAMYHDQGLSVLKHQGFGEAANITLGLPIIRTSVDHGTALDIAGTGKAEIGSLNTAINIATEMARQKFKTKLN